MDTIFITGIGTGVGKTVVSAIVAQALGAAYWKPVQAGYADGTDSEWVRSVLSQSAAIIPEAYKLKLAASPHIAATEEGVRIDLHVIQEQLHQLSTINHQLVIEGAGGLLVPLNEKDFMADLIHLLGSKLILVSRNYLGSINHSLLTAEVCRQYKLDVLGWVFNDRYMSYEDEIVHWSGYPRIASIPVVEKADAAFIASQARLIKEALIKLV